MKFARVAGIGILALVAACSNPSNSDLPVKTILWDQPGDGNYRFYTNDKQYYGYGFYRYVPGSGETFSNGTAVVRKVSGPGNVGYGVVFCYQDVSNFYRLLIDNLGHYNVWENLSGNWSQIIGWTSSSAIITSGAENTISVSNDGSGDFKITINGTVVNSFTNTDLTADVFGIDAGVGTSQYENFPNHPVEVRGRFTAPVVAPASTSADIEPSRVTAGANSSDSGLSKQP